MIITDEDRATIELIADLPTPSEEEECAKYGLDANGPLLRAGWTPCFKCYRAGAPKWHRNVAPYDCKTASDAVKELS